MEMEMARLSRFDRIDCTFVFEVTSYAASKVAIMND